MNIMERIRSHERSEKRRGLAIAINELLDRAKMTCGLNCPGDHPGCPAAIAAEAMAEDQRLLTLQLLALEDVKR